MGFSASSGFTPAGGSSGGFIPAGGSLPGSFAPKKKRDLAALLQDIEDMAAGLINAPVALTKSTAHSLGYQNDSPGLGDIGQGIVDSYKDMYGPAAHGDWGAFLEKLREHPLQPILDVATVATLGGAGVGKLGQLAAQSGKGGTALTKLAGYTAATPEAVSGAKAAGIGHLLGETPGLVPRTQMLGTDLVGEGQQLARVLPRNPVVRLRKEAVRGALDTASERTPLGPLSTAARDARAFKREDRRRQSLLFQKVIPQAEKQAGKLDRNERLALVHLIEGTDPEAKVANVLEPQLRELPQGHRDRLSIEAEIKEIRDNPDMVEAVRNPSPRLRAAHAAAKDVVEHQQSLAAAHGVLSADSFKKRAWMPAQIQSGGRLVPVERVKDEGLVASLHDELATAKAARDDLRSQSPNMEDLVAAHVEAPVGSAQEASARTLLTAGHGLRRQTQKQINQLDVQIKSIRSKLDKAESDIVVEHEMQGGKSIPELEAEFAAAGREAPTYFPHATANTSRSKGAVGKASGDVLNQPTRALGEQRLNESYNFLHSRYRRDPQALFEASTRVMRKVDVVQRFNEMLRLSHTVDAREAFDRKMVILNDAQIKNLTGKTQEAITLLDAIKPIVGADPVFEDLAQQYIASLTLAAKEVPEGMVRAVPPELYRAMIGDLDRIGTFARKFDQITDVWRAVVLPLRPAWIVNNAVGNFILLAMADGPWAAVTNLPRAVGLMRGERAGLEAARKLGKTSEYDRVLYQQLQERLPDIIASGQVRRETGGIAARGAPVPKAKLRQAGNKVVRAGVKGVDVATEFNAVLTDDLPRVINYLTKMDKEVGRARKLPAFEGMSDAQIADALLADDAFASRLSQSIMSDLLDYGSLTQAERTYARRLVPFYAWNRLITQYTIRQLLDRPAILLGMEQASPIGIADTERERGQLPAHLRGAIPVGDEGVLTTKGLNPFETPATIAKTLGGLFGTGQSLFGPDTIGSQIGPIPAIAAETLTGKEIYGGPVRLPFSRSQGNPEGTEVPIGLRPFTQFGGNLPIVGLAERGVEDLRNVDRGQSMYEPGFLQYLASYMGLPYRHLNTPVAQSRAFEDRARANQPAQTVGLFG